MQNSIRTSNIGQGQRWSVTHGTDVKGLPPVNAEGIANGARRSYSNLHHMLQRLGAREAWHCSVL